MQALEKLYERELQRYGPDILDPVTVTSVADIKMVLMTFDPAKNPQSSVVPVSAIVQNDKHRYAVNADTKSKSQRDILLEGLDFIKNRLEADADATIESEAVLINGRQMEPATVQTGVDGYSWIDPMIKHWFGGYRDGTHVCWDLDGYQYRYDPYQHKLTRKENET